MEFKYHKVDTNGTAASRINRIIMEFKWIWAVNELVSFDIELIES